MSEPGNVRSSDYLAAPIIVACQRHGLFRLLDMHEFRERKWLLEQLRANEGYFTIALEFLESIGWLSKNGADAYRLTDKAERDLHDPAGLRFAHQRSNSQSDALGPIRSYQPIVDGMEDLLFGNHRHISAKFKGVRCAEARLHTTVKSHEDDSYVTCLKQNIVHLFDQQSPETHPQAIVSFGCGDGYLLKEIFRTICDQTLEGRRLHTTPVRLVVVCSNAQALNETEKALDGIQYQVLLAEGNQPGELNVKLEQLGFTSQRKVLFVDLFAARSLAIDTKEPIDETPGILAADQPVHYLDPEGGLLNAVTVLSSWRNRFQALAQNLGGSRLLAMESHSAPSQLVGRTAAGSEEYCRDVLGRLAHEYSISADAFITLAASQGLFNDRSVVRHPKGPAACVMSAHYLIKRDYIVRHAKESDLDRLWQIEELCWQHTRTSRRQIRSRLRKYPQGQFVLEKEGRVLGAIYSQRIASAEAISACTAAGIDRLHDASGEIVQLLAVNMDPEAQNASYGDQLLEFMLQRCSVMAGIKQVVGVTLCKSYRAKDGVSFEKYIRQRGSHQDPVLAFHQAHGAKIVKSISGYRPQDKANLGNGVLVAYDISERTPRRRGSKPNRTAGAEPGAGLSGITRRQIEQFVVGEVARILGTVEKQIDLERPLMEMGLNSADLLKLQQQIENKFCLSLQAGFFFEHNNTEKVIEHLAAKLVDRSQPDRHETVAGVSGPQAVNGSGVFAGGDGVHRNRAEATDIAIIGVSCKLPGGIETPEHLWQLLASERCVVGPFPRARCWWPAGSDRPGIDQGGFIQDLDVFDAAFFRISPTEAERTDPQQRILLQLAWACLEDAAVVPATLKGANIGVFIGASNCDYSHLVQKYGLRIEAHHGIGNSLAILANRLSYFFDLCGPSLIVDTACSSSLVALHTAVQSLRSGECMAALVGGVNVICHPDLSVAYHRAGMLAPDGRCKTFDVKANGYARSEGAVMLFLKAFSQAIADGDQIHAVIKGSAMNHGGLAGGLTVPNPQKQSELLQAAWKNAGVAPQELTYIEAHGTGTPLGDPIEIEGIQTAYRGAGSPAQLQGCGIGSVKSNLGHLESAAGLAGVLKVVMSMQRRQLPASINFTALNPKIDLDGTPYYIQDRCSEWKGERLRVAGVSSFGSGGANAHVVLQEYVRRPEAVSGGGQHLFVLSAADQDRLKEYVAQVIAWLETRSMDASLVDAIYSWQVGRTAMKQRLAVRVTDQPDLLGKLRQWIATGNDDADVWCGQASPDTKLHRVWRSASGQQLIDRALCERDLEQLALLWTSGVEIEWQELYRDSGSSTEGPRRISVPTYPFAKERYWIDTKGPRAGSLQHAAPEQAVDTCEISTGRSLFTTEGEETGSLMAAPAWQPSTAENLGEEQPYAEHHIVLCEGLRAETEELERLLSTSRFLSLKSVEGKDFAQRYSECALACFERVQAILQSKPRGKVLIQILVSCEGEQALLAGLVGLLKTAAQENPQVSGQLILVPGEMSSEELGWRLQEEKRAPRIDALIRYEHGERQILVWQEVQEVPEAKIAPVFKEEGLYLITGGLGGLGVIFATEILKQTLQARVVLTGRGELDEKKQAHIKRLFGEAGRVSYRQLDLENLEEVRRLLAGIQEEYGRLNGVLHSAGMIADNPILKKTVAEFRQVLAPKVRGTCNLDEASRGVDLDFFVLFSSVAGAMGNPGSSDYAVANGFLDQFAYWRNAKVVAGTRHGWTRSINWPWWQAGGMEIDRTTRERLQQATGMQLLQTATGLNAFYRSLALPFDQVLVVEGIREKITSYYLQRTSPPLNADIEDSSPTTTLEAATEVKLDELQHQLKVILATVLRIDMPGIDVDQAFAEFGLDSFLGAEMVVAINKKYGTSISNIKVFDHPTVREFSLFLRHEIGKLGSHVALRPSAQAARSILQVAPSHPGLKATFTGLVAENQNASEGKIAVIGMSGRYPKAHNLRQYWQNLVQGRNCVVDVPPARWDVSRYYDPDPTKRDKTNSKWLGALDDIDCFDPLFFRISPQEAKYMDPQHRLFLEESYKAFEDAGYCSTTLANKKCGVYLGITTNEYGLLLSRNGALPPPVTSNNIAIAASRIAYYLNLKGPAISVDTACSSSMVAIHLACQALLSGEVDMALAGGVTLWLTPESYIAISQTGMFSPVGRCKTFDETADGMVNAEGVGVVVLKRLNDARKDGDFIHGVILGSGINQDGRTNGITAPSVISQTELERAVYSKHSVDPETISYIEAHGTGTRLGDPIELEALATVFKEKTSKKNFCALGSVKSNIGHTTAAAGVASVQKVLLAMRHQTLTPSLHVTRETSRFDFKNSPFYICRETKPWDVSPGSLRRAAVSSFGFSGTNAHMVIEEYSSPIQEKGPASAQDTKVIIPLSARKPEQLKQRARDLLDCIRQEASSIDLEAMAYTLQVGRDAMEERVALIVNSVDQLAKKLEAYLAGEREVEDAYQGQVRHGKESIGIISQDDEVRESLVNKWITNGKYSKLVELWVKGLEVEWSKLHGESKPQRMSLPTYPFARERYWVEMPERSGANANGAGTNALHPLLHRNTSDLRQQSYSTTFAGDEFFLRAEGVGGQMVPAGVFLEMARVAVEQAAGGGERGAWELCDVVWGQPAAVGGEKTLHVRLRAGEGEEIEYEIYSHEIEEEVIHCQGRALGREPEAMGRLVLEQLKESGERLVPVRLAAEVAESTLGEYGLHPSVVEGALEAGARVLGQVGMPVALERMRILMPCQREMYAWARHAEDSGAAEQVAKVDIDVCNASGNVCAQLLGVSWPGANAQRMESVVEGEPAEAQTGKKKAAAEKDEKYEEARAGRMRQEIALDQELWASVAAGERKKPAGIQLLEPIEVVTPAKVSGQRPSEDMVRVRLAAREENATLAGKGVRLFAWGEGILAIIASASLRNVSSKARIRGLLQALAQARQQSNVKALILSGLEHVVGRGREGYNDAVEHGLYRELVEFPYPTIGAVAGDAKEGGFLAAAVCDLLVLNEEGTYGYTDGANGFYPTVAEAEIFAERFGAAQAQELLNGTPLVSGRQLRAKGWTCPVVGAEEIEGEGERLAAELAKKPQTALTLLKQHLTRKLGELVKNLTAAGEEARATWACVQWPQAEWKKYTEEATQQALLATSECEEKSDAAQSVSSPIEIPLLTRAVRVRVHPEGVVVVRMEDRGAKNMFSEALIEGVGEAFAHIEDTPGYKVVVLTGYENYFASGGTRESLLAIQAGRMKFTDSKMFQVALECKLPVVAAMQGHGIGAGWCLGLFADVVVMSEESRYVSPYMSYGFTPGAGATYILPQRLGSDVARESLLTGKEYSGRELKERGVKIAVKPRAEVVEAAMGIARQMAQAEREWLLEVKRQRREQVGGELEETYRLELAMHEKTFVGRADTLAEIEKKFLWEGKQDVSEYSEESEVREESVPAGKVEAAGVRTEEDVLGEVTASLKELLANELLIGESEIDDGVEFVDLGLDSISGVTWVRKINEKYGTKIEATKVYSCPTLSQLSRYVKEEAEKQGRLLGAEAAAAVATAKAARSEPRLGMAGRAVGHGGKKLTSWRKARASRYAVGGSDRSAEPVRHGFEPIAVVGMAGQFPEARNLEEFWRNICEGRNCITQVAAERWDVKSYYQAGKAVAGKSNSQWMGALKDYACFDPLFFNISPTEAESMDPQQRLFLQACWHSIEDAGYDARLLSGSKCGVFAGCTAGDYHHISQEHQLSAQGFTGQVTSMLAARVSYFLNLQGPCISIDTACSSSLVALAYACDSLISGSSDLALTGGVWVMAGPQMHIMTSQAGMLSPQGQCYTFDQRADGFVPGEGVGVVLLKRLGDAQRDGDLIYGVLEGWGVNQDGKTNGITAPNPESQTRLEQEVYEKFGIDPGGIQLIEAHGTGTKLGDPIEVAGLKQAFQKYTEKQGYCALGSVKSNIGHCLAAAGIAGVIKLLLALKHRRLPPTINFERLNEHIELEGSPFYVNRGLQEWEAKGGERRRGATSSFGFSGTNAHVVIGEYVGVGEGRAGVDRIRPEAKAMVPLSARTAAQLKEKARDLLEHIGKAEAGLDLQEVAYTLQVGRAAMPERVGFVVSSLEELGQKLAGYVAGERMEEVYEGQARRGAEGSSVLSSLDEEMRESIVGKYVGQKKLGKLLELWVQGLEVNWKQMYGEEKPRRISLPGYPFAKERYWIEAQEGMAGGGSKGGELHPMLHRNTSDLNEQRYSSTFSGEEFFLADHRVRLNGQGPQKTLPGVAYLEMARAAIAQAWPAQIESTILELRNTVWLTPFMVTEPKEISISLFSEDDDRIGYEIYSIDSERETIHCQGQAAFVPKSTRVQLDIEKLNRQMERGRVDPARVYAVFAQMGLYYGPAHQGITDILIGENQLLAHLHLPTVAVAGRHEYVLHPNLMDAALQASIGLVIDSNYRPSKPSVPFISESLRIISACTSEMAAWIRYSHNSTPEDKIVKLDMDLCDPLGNVCVQVQGISLRSLAGEASGEMTTARNNTAFDSSFYQKLVLDIVNRDVSVDEAVALG